MPTKPIHLVIPCAGLGTRLLPISAYIPKEILPIGKWPALLYSVLEAFQAGIEHIIIVTSAEKKEFLRYAFTPKTQLIHTLKQKGNQEWVDDVARLGILDRMTFVEQYPLAGLGHAVLCAEEVVKDDPFCVSLPDEHLRTKLNAPNELEHLVRLFQKEKKSCITLFEVPKKSVSSYGIAKLGDKCSYPNSCVIDSCIEKPHPAKTPSTWALVGRYLFTPEIWPLLHDTSPGAGGEIQLTDALNRLATHQKLLGHFFQGERVDIGFIEGYYACTRKYP